ncbi:MAG: glycoside hydrolase family 3 N-terminal domain-containing protein [Actinocrinis sp.]
MPDDGSAVPDEGGAFSGLARPHRRVVLMGAAGIGLSGLTGVGIGNLIAPIGPEPQPGSIVPAHPLPPGLTPVQLAGQRVIYSYPGLTPPASLLSAIGAGQVAGVIFFGENISSESQIAAVITKLRQAAASSPVKLPLLLMTDQEGGLVRRLPGAPALSAKQVGEASDPVAAAKTAGNGAGLNLKGVGMNVNLAPVLDVFYTAGNFIDQYQRSFSNNPATVSALGKAFVAAQQATGVAATVKHFPGLGAASKSQNTDLGPVTLYQSLSQLRGTDEAPYPAAIAAGAKLVMCSWAVYPALDANRPAGMSSAVVTGELRGRLGYNGVVITDAIEAGALSAHGTTGQRAVSAAAAGTDLMLCSARDVSQGQAATTALANAYTGGQLNQDGFKVAAYRIALMRRTLF